MAAACAAVDNRLFYMDKTMMVFGDAKKVIEDIVRRSNRCDSASRSLTAFGRN